MAWFENYPCESIAQRIIDGTDKIIRDKKDDITVRCPNCGSAAQVKETFSNYSTSLGAQCNSYECGCGCLFHTWKYKDGRVCGEWKIFPKEEDD